LKARQQLSRSIASIRSIIALSKSCLRSLIVLLNIVALLICTTGQVAAQTKVTYFHNDLSGNPVAASNSTGQIIWRESYRPYGERLKNEAASQTNSQWYTGHRQDADTGLVYMGARHYDPLIGRFLSIDPSGFGESNPHSFNRYAYANNNPMKFTDPDGRFAQAIAVGGAILVGGAIVYVTTTNEQRQEIADGFRALSRQFSNLLNATADNGNSSSGDGNSNSGADNSVGKEPPVPGATRGRETKGRTTQWEKDGGMDEANKDFDAKAPQGVTPLPDGGRRGTLSDGRQINVRPDSSDGRPTLEIQNGKNRDKVRYDQ
jgi:RHS repeat-associated protein